MISSDDDDVIPCEQDTRYNNDDSISGISINSSTGVHSSPHNSIGDNDFAYGGGDDEYLAEISPVFVAVKEEYAESVDYEISKTETIDTIEESKFSISSLPEFDGKIFPNIAKEGFTLDSSDDAKADWEAMIKKFEPLNKWLNDVALNGLIIKR